jgi:DNA-binding response OmpR family regulator
LSASLPTGRGADPSANTGSTPVFSGRSEAIKNDTQNVSYASVRNRTREQVTEPHPVRGLYDGLKPQRLATLLACAPGNVISKQELAARLFNDAPTEDEGLYLRQLVYKLRKAGYRIESFHGYRLVSAP